MVIKFRRVSYSKDSTPRALREYRIMSIDGEPLPMNQRPVGTRKEIYAWAKQKGIPRRDLKISEEKENEQTWC